MRFLSSRCDFSSLAVLVVFLSFATSQASALCPRHTQKARSGKTMVQVSPGILASWGEVQGAIELAVKVGVLGDDLIARERTSGPLEAARVEVVRPISKAAIAPVASVTALGKDVVFITYEGNRSDNIEGYSLIIGLDGFTCFSKTRGQHTKLADRIVANGFEISESTITLPTRIFGR